jgi:Zn-dependent protease with chaperone function
MIDITREPEAASKFVLATKAAYAELVFFASAFLLVLPFLSLYSLWIPIVWLPWVAVAVAIGVWLWIQPNSWTPQNRGNHSTESIKKMVAALTEQAQGKKIHQIVLTDDINAAAYQSRGLLGILFTKRVLIVGIPLLRALTIDQFKAVIAHEIGHFSHNHGRFGHWIYQVRYKWLMNLQSDNAASIFITRNWIKNFLKQSAAWSRQCEFEADAISSQLTSPGALISGLYRLNAIAHYESSDLLPLKRKMQLENPDAPSNYWDWVCTQGLKDRAALIASADAQYAKRQLTSFDSHPHPKVRASALGIDQIDQLIQSDIADESPCAGLGLFGESDWPLIMARCNQRWNESHTLSWRMKHAHLRTAKALATQMEELPQLSALAATDTLGNSWVKLPEYADSHPDSARAQYEAGLVLFERLDSKCIDYFRQSIKINPAFGGRVSQLILRYQESYGSEAEIEHSVKRCNHYSKLGQFVNGDMFDALLKADILTCESMSVAVLTEIAGTDQRLDAAWTFSLKDTLTNLPYAAIDVLVIRVKPEILNQIGKTDDDLRFEYQYFCEQVSSPDRLCVVFASFTTEVINPHVYKRISTSKTVACLKTPSLPINQHIIKIDSLG